MAGCSYCGVPGCGWETCPKRLEDKFGTPADAAVCPVHDLVTDDGRCPECEGAEVTAP